MQLAHPKACKLALFTAMLFAIWLVFLPWIGRMPGISEHIQTMKDLRIHPDAMFYTELEPSPIRDPYDEPFATE